MKQLIKNVVAPLLAFVIISFTPKVQAQDAPIMALNPTLMAGWTGNLAITSNGTSSPAATRKVKFAYTSTPALRQQVVSNFAKRLQGQNPQGARTLTAAFGPGKSDYDQIYQELLKTSALHNNDAADALAGLLLVGYQLTNQLNDKQITPAMERGARAQVAAILGQNPKMSSASVRAQLSEEFKLQTVLMALGWQETIKNNTQAAYRQSIAAMFKSQYHMDMASMKLTAQGFNKK